MRAHKELEIHMLHCLLYLDTKTRMSLFFGCLEYFCFSIQFQKS